MKMYCDIVSKNKCSRPYYFDGMTIEHPEFGEVEIEWDEYDHSVDKDGHKHSYRFKGIMFRNLFGDEDEPLYANGKLFIFKKSKLVEVVVTDVDDNCYELGEDFVFVNDSILFEDDEEEFELIAK